MGQGNYMGFVYGAVLSKTQRERLRAMQEQRADVAQASALGRVRQAYEAEDYWCGVFIATPDLGLAEDYEVGSLSRQALPLSELVRLLRRAKHYGKAQHGYETFREVCSKHGLELPSGEILAVFDYD